MFLKTIFFADFCSNVIIRFVYGGLAGKKRQIFVKTFFFGDFSSTFFNN